jgi:hypothetical protein
MLTFNSLPQARVVRKAGQVMPPPRSPRDPEASVLQTALAYAIGLWPLTCVVLVLCGLLVMAGYNGAP